MIEARGLTKRYGDTLAVDNLSFSVEPGQDHRFPRPERRGQDHHDAADPRPGPADQRHGDRQRQAVRQLAYPMREVGALLDAKAVHGGRSAYNHLLCLAQTNNLPAAAGRRGAGPRRPERGRAEALQGLLPGHGAAAGHRRRAARRPGHPDVRRAGQRARPRGHPVDPQPDEGAGGRGPHDLRLQPPDVGDGEHRRSPAGDRPRQADRGLHGARVHRGQLRSSRSGSGRRSRRAAPGRSPRPGGTVPRTATA